MEEAFKNVVTHIFNNWTALRLAVEHSMGGPNSKQTALECLNYMINYCINTPNIQVEDIEEALEDILDQEFETVCEDDSPKEISVILFNFLNILKAGNMAQYELEFNKLPIANAEWLNSQISNQRVQQQNNMDASSCSSSSEEEDKQTNMEDDWTEVKSRRKK